MKRKRLSLAVGAALLVSAPCVWSQESTEAPSAPAAASGNGSLRTLRLGGGELATVALPRALHGPAGLSVAAGAVWIAETDAHAVLRYDIATGELSHVPIDE